MVAPRNSESDLPAKSIFVDASDFNNDTFPDVVVNGNISWNPGTAAGTWTTTPIGGSFSQVAIVYDFDNDGDDDILGTEGVGAQDNANLVWARNDGNGTFTVLNNIDLGSGNGDFLQGVAVGQFGPGETGPLEVALTWHNGTDGVVMLTVGADPSVDQWTSRSLIPVGRKEALSVGDIDNDGDNDLLMGTHWLRNDQTPTWVEVELHPTNEQADRNHLVDFNGDGRLDALVGFEGANVIAPLAWYEQPATSPEDEWIEHIIAADLIGPMSVGLKDMDNDGDMDVVAGEYYRDNAAMARIFVFENEDGLGLTWTRHLVHTGDEHHDGGFPIDIDLDGDVDILSIGWINDKLVLYENLAAAPPPGNVSALTDADSADNEILENSSAAVVGITAVATTTGMGPVSYSLDLDAGGLFTIAPSTGVVSSTAPLDAETSSSFAITVRATDGDGDFNTGVFSISVLDENEFAPVVTPGQAFEVYELTSLDRLVGIPAATDPDVLPVVNDWQIVSGNESGAFAIDPLSGRITVANDQIFDAQTTPKYDLEITAGDGTNTSAPEIVVVDVLVGGPPEFRLFDQNSDLGLVVDSDGVLVDQFSLSAGSPRGAAVDPETGTMWVSDGNDRVYVYDADGNGLGSWKSQSITKPEGLAHHGDDIWIVDRNTRKVFYYANVASALTGSFSPTSSFDLESANNNPRGLTTDGSSLWIVNDGSPEKVYKYSVAGDFLGEWALDSTNRSPRGITLDPANPSDLWVIDVTRDVIYEYADATSRTSGSQSANVIYDTSDHTTLAQAIIRSGPTAPPAPADPAVHFTRLDMNPTNAAALNFRVEFTESVENVDVSDFAVSTTETVTFAGLSLNDTAGVFTLTVDGVSGDGIVEIVVNDTTDITAASDGRTLDRVPATSETYVVDNTGPVVTVDQLTTSNTSPALSGTTDDSGAVISIELAANSYTATNNGDGTWSLPAGSLVAPLAEGNYDVTVTATDVVGNIGTDSSTNELTIEPPPSITSFFFVVDSGLKKAFGYDENFGADVEFGLNASHPRGVATDAFGETVWTVNFQNTVTIYDNIGTELGSWQADGISKADGIATDGQHVWIVDRIADAIVFYADAATVTSGSLTPTSSFPLAANNDLARGLTTDGTLLWTVDDTSHRVFVYETNGTLLGDWALDSQNSAPRGISIDPSAPEDIWVVDAVDKVFEYTNAAAILSGNQTAAAVYDVSVQPQGIARAGNGIAQPDGPSLSVTRANPNPTTADAVAFDFVFSEPVSNVDITDFDLEITGTVATAQYSLTGSSTNYALLVSNITGDGTLGFSLNAANDIVSADGTPLNPVVTPNQVYLIDNSSPQVTVDPLTTADSTPTLTGTISEPTSSIVVEISGVTFVAADQGNGTWRLDGGLLTNPLAVGTYDVTVTATDLVGQSATDTSTDELIVTEAPASSTKFYVVDSKLNTAYEYEASGADNGEFALGNAHPRGAAADATGTTVWVVNYTSIVSVYDNTGAQTGSWQATGISKPDGIATDGQHIWIVDRIADEVFFFADAAANTSGSIAPTSSFALAANNTLPRGITTDGSHLWVVDDTSNSVFKYDVAGTLVGEWNLASANHTPRGITIDPTDVNHIWVVDGGNDKVYQYAAGATLTSGTGAATVAFDLTNANVQPQGIADPPPATAPAGIAPAGIAPAGTAPAGTAPAGTAANCGQLSNWLCH